MNAEIISMFVALAVIFVALKLLPRLLAGVPFVEPKKAYETLSHNENALMIDVRTPEEFAQSHASGSLNVEPVHFADHLEDKRPYMNEKVYLICLTAQRSAMAAKTLKHLGFKNVSVIDGGLKKWKKQGLPLETS